MPARHTRARSGAVRERGTTTAGSRALAAAPVPARAPRWPVPVALVLFTAIAYGPAIGVPFIGDDYVFLDKTRQASFPALWSFANTDFGWYRPWSRELHFWTLQHVVGPHEPGFRVASLALWLAALLLFLDLARRIAGPRVAAVAVLGVASLSLWGAPLTWISGSQDLWMLAFVLLALWLVHRGAHPWAWLAYALALLSKETAAVTPVIVFAHAREIERSAWRTAVVRTLPFLAVTLVWFAVHPVLRTRMGQVADPVVSGEKVHGPHVTLVRSALSLANADKLVRPDPLAARTAATVASALVLAVAAWWALRGPRGGREPELDARLVRFGVLWCVAGWLPLLHRSIGWHAYYGSLGVLGAWLALAVPLARRPKVATGVILALGLLRGAAAATPSWDWGSEWYQSRAGNMLNVIRTQLLALHPTLPPHTRLYFGNIPNNIGLIAGRSPAVRVWYDDPTLEAGFYSYYRARAPGEPAAPDLFFHFDSTTGIREVFADGRPDPVSGRDARWEDEHGKLAMTFVASGDLLRAAALFDSLAALPHRADAAMYAAVCREVAGASAPAVAGYAAVEQRTGSSSREVREWATRLRASMPRRSPGGPGPLSPPRPAR